ncbi:hypothetical protein TUM4636_26710 [Shewanella glacialipiscicola]|uniref:glucose-1-phosphate thymidylyltransferase n=1 Tax=Shewanella glacialipiscicola TaxID=614069 RepID=A0ABQ6J2E4_9GAMM|nr:hypothetical protein TUM4636_26710 [Shewanella glacialipiscicola]GMA81409.1 hypothetical protein GCM10025855_09420 [Shewanella glacialipiscicola]
MIAESFLAGEACALILGDNVFYGQHLTANLNRAWQTQSRATVFGYHVANPHAYGVIEFNDTGNVLSIEEKPLHPCSH